MMIPAIVGLMAGLFMWNRHGRGRRLLTAFMLVSVLCAVLQTRAAERWDPRGVVLFGDLWELSIVALLVPSLLRIMRRPARTVMVPLTVLALIVWAYFFLGLGYLTEATFHHFLSVWIHALLTVTAYVVVGQCFDDSSDLMRNACFVRSMACLTAGSFDAANNYVRGLYLHIDPTLCAQFKTARDLAWLLAYALLSYSILVQRRSPRSKRFPYHDPDEAPKRGASLFKEAIHG